MSEINTEKTTKSNVKATKTRNKQISKDKLKDVKVNPEILDVETEVVNNTAPSQKDNLSIIESLQQKKTINIDGDVIDEVDEVTVEIEEETDIKVEEKITQEYPRYYDTPVLEGLSTEIVEQRKLDGLVNVGSEDKGKTILGIILSNSLTFFNMLYLIITIIFIMLGSFENLLFLTTIIPNLVIGIVQEIKAKKMIDKLSLMSSPTTTVIRDGQKIEIPVSDVVLDEIIFYTPGKQICTDSVVVEGFIEVNESLLTGEADSINKNVGDQLLSGSFVVSGVAVARADKVGKDNYIEKLSKDAKIYRKPKSELLRTLNGIIKIVSIIILPLAILTYLSSTNDATRDFLGFLNREGLIRAASSILAMIPAGLFLLTSMALAVSVVRLGNSKTLVQELYCIEMLARVNVLCLDKTGTITDGTMRVCDCVEIKNHTDFTIREIVGSMMNTFDDVNPTSEALIKYFDKNKVLEATDKIPFSSKRKFSAVTFGKEGTFLLGAPEFVLTDNFDKVASKVDRFSSEGCRVLILGHTMSKVKSDEIPKNVKPICLIALQDHIREDASDTIDYFKQNGVDVKVISGDNPVTVSEIAQRAGVEGAERYISLAGLTDDEVRESVFEYTVFGRVSPNQKRIIVKALKDHKKIVAMTGDGVNDILALKEADCSIAMASGSEATRYVSHLVLMDSNFSSMPKVVQEGRRVINNIQKTSTLFLVKTMFSILLAIMYIILGVQEGLIKMSYPFNAKNLYMIEWFAIGIPAFFLALQPNRELVKGKFLPNVIKSTLPGAITIVLLHLLLNVVRIIPGFEDFHQNQAAFTTIATITTTMVMMVVLYQVSYPFNLPRKLVYIAMIVLCLLAGFDLIPFMKLDLSYRKNVDSYNVEVVPKDSYWHLEGKPTIARAVIEPTVNNKEGNTYVLPVITINKDDKWCLNGFVTEFTALDGDVLNIEVQGKYWYLNGSPTKAKAVLQPEIIFLDERYLQPTLTIDKGYWCLDSISTKITAISEPTLKLSVNHLGYWVINGKVTQIKATEKVANENEYITPIITIVSIGEKRIFAINGIVTNIEAFDGDKIDLEAIDGYWYINLINSYVKAERINDNISDESEYVNPVLEINRFGKWTINGIETTVKAENNLLINEIIITLLFVQLVNPMMYLISTLLKKFKLVSE